MTREEIARHQMTDEFCTTIRQYLNQGEKIPFLVDDTGVLVRTVEADPQVVVPHAPKARVLNMGHHTTLAGHPGGRKMYYTLRKDYYWPALAVDCYATVRNCSDCARERVKLRRNSKRLRLFPAKGPLEETSIDILGELIRTPRGNKYLVVITDRFSKLVRTVPLKRIRASDIADAFVQHWVLVYGPPISVLADNGGQFISKFFQSVCSRLGIKNIFTTTYHPQTNGQAERFNRTILSAIRHYTAEHPRDWDLYTGMLTYAYNTQVHRTTNLSPFELVLSRRPRPLSVEAKPIFPEIESMSGKAHRDAWLARLDALVKTAESNALLSRNRYKKDFDKRLRLPKDDIKTGYFVFVRRDYTSKAEGEKHKLAPRADGPYKVFGCTADTVDLQIGEERERVSRDRVVLAPTPASEISIVDKPEGSP